MAPADKHKWVFKARFRGCSFGSRSQPAIQRIKEAVSEIRKVRRKDPVLADEGAIMTSGPTRSGQFGRSPRKAARNGDKK